MRPTYELLRRSDFPAVRRTALDILQVNMGYRCNQTCQHCHVNAGPNRLESMGMETLELVLQVLKARGIKTLDITGGAPELNPGWQIKSRHCHRDGWRGCPFLLNTRTLEPYRRKVDIPTFISLPADASVPWRARRSSSRAIKEKSIRRRKQIT